MKVRFLMGAKLQNKALGLKGPDVERYRAGDVFECDAKTLDKMKEMYGDGVFEVVQESKPKPKRGKSDG